MKDSTTGLQHLFQSDPLRALFPTPPESELPTAVIASTAGGLVGGDRLELSVTVGDDARALATVQAAEKAYRSVGPDSHIEVSLSVGARGWLEWLPQETILFNGARLRRATRVTLHPDARLLAGEMIVLGRIASGERFRQGLLHDAWEVRRSERLLWADSLHLEREIENVLEAPAGFDGGCVCATAIYVGPDAGERLETARELLPQQPGVRAGATLVGDVLVIRWLGQEPLVTRNHFGTFWAGFRHRTAGLPHRLPRLWHT